MRRPAPVGRFLRKGLAVLVLVVVSAGLGLIAGHLFSAPYEDVKLKTK